MKHDDYEKKEVLSVKLTQYEADIINLALASYVYEKDKEGNAHIDEIKLSEDWGDMVCTLEDHLEVCGGKQ